MTIDYYHATFVKQWKAMLLCFLTVILGILLISKTMTPIYQVSVLMQVTPHLMDNQADSNATLATDRLLQTEIHLAISEAVLREVASHFQDITLEQLTHRTQATPQPDTLLFEITVQDASSVRAAALANAIAQTLLKQQSSRNTQAAEQALAQIQQDLASAQRHIESVSEQVAELQEQDKRSGQVLALQDELSGLQQHYNQLQNAQAQLELLAAQNSTTLQIVQPAEPDGRLVRPNIPLNLLASLPVAFSLSILLALLLETWNTHIRTAAALSLLLQWPVLTSLWRIRGVVDRQELVHLPAQEAFNVESYRTLRTNLSFSSVDRAVRTLAVTSATAGDGKSVIAANLAISMARVGKNTLLIDADLHSPVLHELFSIGADKMGLSEAILTANVSESTSKRSRAQFLTPRTEGNTLGLPRASHFSIDSFVHDVGLPNLRIMPAGTLPPDPAELLASRAMQRLFIALQQSDAEVIIFDTPPLEQCSDGCILASRVDGTLVVVDVSRARKGQLKQLKCSLTQAGAHVLGCVVNKLRSSRSGRVRVRFDAAEVEVAPTASSYEAAYAYSHEQEDLLEEQPISSRAVHPPVVATRPHRSTRTSLQHVSMPKRPRKKTGSK